MLFTLVYCDFAWTMMSYHHSHHSQIIIYNGPTGKLICQWVYFDLMIDPLDQVGPYREPTGLSMSPQVVLDNSDIGTTIPCK